MRKRLVLFMVFLFCGVGLSRAQFIAHEVGITVGAVSFQSDYGERGDFRSTAGNIGLNIGVVYYMDLSWITNYRLSYIEDHFRLKGELSFTKVNFEHYGKWVEPGRTSVAAQQLRAMHGSTSIFNIGADVVWFPLGVKFSNYNVGGFSPFMSVGGQINHYIPEAMSDLGPIGLSSTTPQKYLGAQRNRSGLTSSFVVGIGTRYKIDRNTELSFGIRGQYFFSDWVDGLKPNPQVYKENKSNDFLIGINVGYIYQFD